MITEDYVSFETAKLLKEKGFDEAVRFEYHNVINENTRPTFHRYLHNFNGNEYSGLHSQWYSAPTLQMAMKWLREVHHIFIDIDWNARPESEGFSNKPYFSLITNMNTNEFYRGKNLPDECASYEQAAEAAIKYCLENLI